MTTRIASRARASQRPADEAVVADGEGALLEGLRRGHVEALAMAFDRCHQRVRVLARRLLSDAATADDLVQDVFTVLPDAVKRFRGDVELERFLLGIAVKRVRRHQRAAARRRRALDRLSLEARRAPPDPEQDVYRHELGLKLAAVLDRLPLAQPVAVVLCDVEEMTSAQASELAGVPEATIRPRL